MTLSGRWRVLRGPVSSRIAQACVTIAAAAAVPSTALAAFRIEPGPTVISEEERAIQPDPERGMQHAVILLEESERDDPISGYAKTSFHLRAKILSNEGRALADVEIPFEAKRGYLRKWWGRTIKPDGTVIELGEDDLHEQTVVRSQGVEAKVLRAALPGVEPGCVIDYGYVFQERIFHWYRKVPLQREWPIEHFRYRWLPSGDLIGQYYIRRTAGIGLAGDAAPTGGSPGGGAAPGGPRVGAVRESQAIVVEGWDLPAYQREPMMPPEDVVRASVLFHYLDPGLDVSSPERFWRSFADRVRRRLEEFLDDRGAMKSVLAGMGIPPEAPAEERVQAVHDWISGNIRNVFDKTSEELEAEAYEAARERDSKASVVLEIREGLGQEIDDLFIGLVRGLGIEAYPVLAPRRSSGTWDKALLFSGQLSSRAVAIILGEGADARPIFTDPCSGLRFGEVPWEMTPSIGMMISKAGPVEVVLPGSDPRQNVHHSQASIAWDDEGEARVKWSAVAGGQRNSRTIRMLRRRSPDERKEALSSLCGASSRFEVTVAEAPGMEDLLADYQIACEGVLTEAGLDPSLDELSLSFEGRWIPDTPAFVDESRVHPVVFEYPFIDTSVLDVEAPQGYALQGAPAPVKIGTPYSSYALSITPTEKGCRVQRAFAIVKSIVPKEDYGVLRAFLQDVERFDRSRLTFVRKERSGE